MGLYEEMLALEERTKEYQEERAEHQSTLQKLGKLYELSIINEKGEKEIKWHRINL